MNGQIGQHAVVLAEMVVNTDGGTVCCKPVAKDLISRPDLAIRSHVEVSFPIFRIFLLFIVFVLILNSVQLTTDQWLVLLQLDGEV